jgi:hypothetical protein
MSMWLLSTAALADGTVVLNRPVAEFRAIEIGGGAELTVRKGEGPTLVLSGLEEDLKAYRTEVREGVLHLGRTGTQRGRHEAVKVIVTLRSLERLEASGGVAALIEPGAAARTLTLDLSGGVNLKAVGLDLDRLKLVASGGTEATLGGKAAAGKLDLSGGVDLDARTLEFAQLDLEASGGCTIRARATGSVIARATGGVDVKVSGQPAKRRVEASGASAVQFVD